MTKTFHYLAGLPRSGNTLIAALLNQHPDIYTSPLSPVAEILYKNVEIMSYEETCIRTMENSVRLNRHIRGLLNTFYVDVKKPVVIDRSKAWGTPSNLHFIKTYFSPKPKVILTVRNITDILASFVSMNPEALSRDTANAGYYRSSYFSYNDLLCDHLMRLNGEIDKTLLSITMMLDPDNAGMFHIVEYDDLVNNTQKVMSDVYSFLNLPNHINDLSNIKKVEVDHDILIQWNTNTHDIKPTIQKSETNAKEILSEYAYSKYSGMEFWRNDSVLKPQNKKIK
jgi:sulfotransferase